MFTCAVALAEGSRTLFPNGYLTGEPGNTTGSTIRASLYWANGTSMNGVLRQQNFFYIYADAGEYILLGTSGSRANLRLFAPPSPGQTLVQRFGTPGLETPGSGSLATGLALLPSGSTQCGATTGNMTTRALELAGPNSVNGAGSGYTPCYYQVPAGASGVYGVYFGGVNTIERWDVTVRSDANSTTDINGRLFSYAFWGTITPLTNGLYNTHYYVTDDGYRYRQILRGVQPGAYALYANPRGFLDVDGNPLYKDVLGTTTSSGFADILSSATTGIKGQRPTYPMFYSDITNAAVDSPDGLQKTLAALGIPLIPPQPQALSITFENSYGGGATTYVGQGGTFIIDTQNALTYQILLKGGHTPEYDDPAH
ncbi:MAG: hypothetical protein LBV36_00835, partial [Chromatiales bacterium]|nr:hypothetical protein [Chromatiales bacterium]